MISRSFTAISPYIRPAPGTTWAPRARWYAIKVEGGKEDRVASRIANMEGMEPQRVFLPIELRQRKKIRGKQRDSVEVPLLPRIVFAMTELSGWAAIRNLDHVTGFECDPEGFPDPIPDDQMGTFREYHSAWLAMARKRAADGKKPFDRRYAPKFKTLAEAGAYLKAQLSKAALDTDSEQV